MDPFLTGNLADENFTLEELAPVVINNLPFHAFYPLVSVITATRRYRRIKLRNHHVSGQEILDREVHHTHVSHEAVAGQHLIRHAVKDVDLRNETVTGSTIEDRGLDDG